VNTNDAYAFFVSVEPGVGEWSTWAIWAVLELTSSESLDKVLMRSALPEAGEVNGLTAVEDVAADVWGDY
jgi:hypothetical protein